MIYQNKNFNLRRISQSEIRNSAAAESEGGQKFLVDVHSPTPFLFARPGIQFGARSAPSVPFKKGSDLVKQTHLDYTEKGSSGHSTGRPVG